MGARHVVFSVSSRNIANTQDPDDPAPPSLRNLRSICRVLAPLAAALGSHFFSAWVLTPLVAVLGSRFLSACSLAPSVWSPRRRLLPCHRRVCGVSSISDSASFWPFFSSLVSLLVAPSSRLVLPLGSTLFPPIAECVLDVQHMLFCRLRVQWW